MWIYEKKLQYPVKIKNPNPALAAMIISQIGGPDGEIGASMRYLNQRIGMPYSEVVGLLTDVGTEELGHFEMLCAIIYQLTRNLSPEQISGTAFEPYYVDHTTGVYPVAASGVPFDMKYVGVKGDPLADLAESQAAEQKARVTYDNLIRLTDDPDVLDPLRFLREREIVLFQRFGESKRELSSKSPNAESPHPRNHKRINKISNVRM